MAWGWAGVAEQGVDRGEAVVGPDLVSPFVFEMVQERGDQWRVDLGDVQRARLLAGAVGGEAEQQPERVPVPGDRVGAGPGAGPALVSNPPRSFTTSLVTSVTTSVMASVTTTVICSLSVGLRTSVTGLTRP